MGSFTAGTFEAIEARTPGEAPRNFGDGRAPACRTEASMPRIKSRCPLRSRRGSRAGNTGPRRTPVGSLVTEVATAFGIAGSRLPRKKGIAPHQPYPLGASLRASAWLTLVFCLLNVLSLIVVSVGRGNEVARFRYEHGARVVIETPDAPVDEGGSLGAALEARGHEVVDPGALMGDRFGGGQAITRLPDGTLVGGSDRRKDGCALGLDG